MAIATPEPIHLSDYTVPAYLVDHVDLTFHLHPTETRVTSRIQFRPNPATDDRHFFLHGEQLNLISAKIDGVDVSPSFSDDGLTCEVPNSAFVWEAVVEISPSTNTALSGLYMSNGMYCTQCEAEGFRRITYYPDRPDVMAVFDVTIHTALPHALSNGEVVSSQDGIAKWADPWPKPAYLFALVAGDFMIHSDSFTTMSGKDVDLNIYVRSGDENKCDFAMASLKASMSWDEEVYGREYDLSVFNIVAVDDFNMGAMENKSLNIFNSKLVLADAETATDAELERIES
ncbi:MAG: M1 family aminopeptidase, partial [Planktomarina sp.]